MVMRRYIIIVMKIKGRAPIVAIKIRGVNLSFRWTWIRGDNLS